MAETVGSEVKAEVKIDTSPALTSLKKLATTGIDPVTAKLQRMVSQTDYFYFSIKRIATYSAIFGFFRMLLKEFRQLMELELRIAEVSTLVDLRNKDMAESFKTVVKQIMTLDPHLGKATDLVKGLYEIMSAGVSKPAEALKLLTLSAKYAKAGVTELSTAAAMLTSVMKAYGYAADDMRERADELFTSVMEGKFHVADLNEAIGRVLPFSAAMGVSLREVAAALAVLSQRGLDASEAATVLSRILISFLRPSTKDAATWLNRLGIEAGVNAFRSRNLVETFKLLREEMQRHPEVLSKIFTRQRGLLGATVLVGHGLDEMIAMLEKMEKQVEGTGEVQRAYEKIVETNSETLKALSAEVQQAMSRFLKFSGIIKAIIKGVGALTVAFAGQAPVVTTVSGLMLVLYGALRRASVRYAQLKSLQDDYDKALKRGRITQSLFNEAIENTSKKMNTLAVGMKILRGAMIALTIGLTIYSLIAENIRKARRAQEEYNKEIGELSKKYRNLMSDMGLLKRFYDEMGLSAQTALKRMGTVFLKRVMTDIQKMREAAVKGRVEAQEELRKLFNEIRADLKRSLGVSFFEEFVSKEMLAFDKARQLFEETGEITAPLIDALARSTYYHERVNQFIEEGNKKLLENLEVRKKFQAYMFDYLRLQRNINDMQSVLLYTTEELMGFIKTDKLKEYADIVGRILSGELLKDEKIKALLGDLFKNLNLTWEEGIHLLESFGKRVDEAITGQARMQRLKEINEGMKELIDHQKQYILTSGEASIKIAQLQGALKDWLARGGDVKKFVDIHKDSIKVLQNSLGNLNEGQKKVVESWIRYLQSSGKETEKYRKKVVDINNDMKNDVTRILADIEQYENELNMNRTENVATQARKEIEILRQKYKERIEELQKTFGYQKNLWWSYSIFVALLQKKMALAEQVVRKKNLQEYLKEEQERINTTYRTVEQQRRAMERLYGDFDTLMKDWGVTSKEELDRLRKIWEEFFGDWKNEIEHARTKTEEWADALSVIGRMFSSLQSLLSDVFGNTASRVIQTVINVVDTLAKGFRATSSALKAYLFLI